MFLMHGGSVKRWAHIRYYVLVVNFETYEGLEMSAIVDLHIKLRTCWFHSGLPDSKYSSLVGQ